MNKLDEEFGVHEGKHLLGEFVVNLIFVGASFAIISALRFGRVRVLLKIHMAGGGVHPVLNGMAATAGWMMRHRLTLTMAGLLAMSGYGASAYLMGWTGGYVLLALLLAPYLRKFGKVTVPDLLATAFIAKPRVWWLWRV